MKKKPKNILFSILHFLVSSQSGFSLAEVLIVVAIAGAVVLVVGNVGTNVSGLNGLISNNLQSKSDIAQTLQIITSEIRSAAPSAAGAYPIVAAATSSFSFYDSVNANGVVDYISYYLASSTIYRAVIAPTGTPATYPTSSQIVYDMIDNVSLVSSSASSSTPLFTYYGTSYTGSAGQALTSPTAVATVRLVQISFSSATEKNPSQPSPPQYFSSLVDIRNLDSN
jgi:prepilin-type N-terminal cleavage/methylation domain-containing protein